MDEGTFDIGMVGLGVMGRNLALNMADHGFKVAGYDQDPEKLRLLNETGRGKAVAAPTIAEMVRAIRTPRAIMMMVPAGSPVDAVIAGLQPLLQAGDILIDGGNSHFTDTEARQARLAQQKHLLLGVGISGGERGAREGPSIMPGGPPQAYERVGEVLETIAARFNGEPCCAYMGPGSAGHYVKMVHNGIEYGIMEAIAETYDLMKRALGMSNDEMSAAFAAWDKTLPSFLLEITARILLRPDERSSRRLVDMIRDEAGQKGTGMWTSQDAMNLQAPIPSIDIAVSMRDLSGQQALRRAVRGLPPRPVRAFSGDRSAFLRNLGDALYASMLLTYAQGLALLQAASAARGYHLDLALVAGIWRAGCIIRSSLLEVIRRAYGAQSETMQLLAAPEVSEALAARLDSLRQVAQTAAALAIPAPGLMAALGYYDSYRSDRLPANLIQAQRDYFGAHTFQRTDMDGTFHVDWDA